MRWIWIVFMFFLYDKEIQSPPFVGKNYSIYIEDYNTLRDEGVLVFEVDVKIADCIHRVVLTDITNYKEKKNIFDKIYDWWYFKVRKKFNFEISKTISIYPNIDNYYLKDSDDGSEIIMLKTKILSTRSLFKKQKLKTIKIQIYNLSEREVFTKVFNLDKNKLDIR